jgi:hypothetical protein
MSDLESRYRRLLLCYPPHYRERRGPEILATLLDGADPGRRRPAPREAAALVTGGLRARAGMTAPGSRAQLWASALRVGTLLLLAHAAAQAAAHAGRLVFSELLMGRGLIFTSQLGHLAALAACVLALLAVAAGRHLVGLLLVLGANAAHHWAFSWYPDPLRLLDDELWPLALAALLSLVLVFLRPAPARRPVLWLIAVPAALVLLPTVFDATLGLQPYALLVGWLCCLAFSVVDARAPIAAGLVLLGPVLASLALVLPPWSEVYSVGFMSLSALIGAWSIAAVLGVAVGTVLIHRRARL